jgi:integrase
VKLKLALQNKAELAAIQPDPARDLFVWDTELVGFALKITPRDRRVWVLQYRNADGRSRRITLGNASSMTPDKARKLAGTELTRIAGGADPVEERRERKAPGMPTVAELADRYLIEHARIQKKPGSAAEDERMIETYVKPQLGRLRVDLVTKTDIRRLQQSVWKGMRKRKGKTKNEEIHSPYQSNRVWALCSRMFNLAEEWGFRPEGSNPCRKVARYPERSRVRYLTPAELRRLGEVLAAAEALSTSEAKEDREQSISPTAAAAIRLLLLTGCRLREILNLRWDQVDLEHQVLRLAESKTGPKAVPLAAPARLVLEQLPRLEGNPYVLPGQHKGLPLTTLRPGWERVIARAELGDLRAHDLRHAFASVAAVAGESLLVIGAILGHTETDTTRKYAHLTANPVLEAAERTAGAIASSLGLATVAEPQSEKTNVVPIRPKRAKGGTHV